MIMKLTLELPEEQAFVRVGRVVGRTLLTQIGANTQDIDEIELVVGELCSNVVRHAHSTEQRFQVTLEYYDDRLVVSVVDQGEGFSRSTVAPAGTDRPDFNGGERIGGYGLHLVEALSHRLEFIPTDTTGTTVRAEMRLHKAPQLSPATA